MPQMELKICGLAAVRGQFAADAGAIKRLYFDYDTGRKVGVISKALAQARKVYRCVEPAELEKIAGTVHHGGIVAVIEVPEWRAPPKEEIADWGRRGEAVVVLDRIGNAHNLGAIVRTAAFFGVKHIVIADDAAAAVPGEAAYRVAEGGMSQVTVWRVKNVGGFLRELVAAGFDVVGAATRGGRPEAKGAGGKRVAIVLGNEEHGLAEDVARACTRLVTIPGSGRVESLNVSAAAAVLLWELVGRAGRKGAG
jgi:rRNA methylases